MRPPELPAGYQAADPVADTGDQRAIQAGDTLLRVLGEDAALVRRQVLLGQGWARYAAAGVVAVAAAVAGRLSGGEAAGQLGVAAALYAVLVAVTARLARRETTGRAMTHALPVLAYSADVLVVAAALRLAAPTAHPTILLILGLALVGWASLYFGGRLGSWVGVLTLAVFLGSETLILREGAQGTLIPGPAIAGYAALFAVLAACLGATLAAVRRRLIALRTLCRRAELGDYTPSLDGGPDRWRDDLTLVARSAEEMRRRLVDLSGTDPLTGCLNRRMFEMRLAREWRYARRRGSTFAVLAIDCDGMTAVNTRYGRSVGDAALQEVAEIIRRTARDTDVVARPTADRFLVLLLDTAWQGAAMVAERVRRGVEVHSFPGTLAGGPRVSVSVGVAMAHGADELTPETLVTAAEQSLANAKGAGRNRISA